MYSQNPDKNITKLCIDLCSGLEGLSAAFRDSKDWEVISIDIEERFSPDVLADIRNLTPQDIELSTQLGAFNLYQVVVILASPPCTYFSRAAGIGIMRVGTAESLNIVAGCVRLIELIRPKGFVIENPDNGYLRFFLGRPNLRVRLNAYGYVTVKPTAFWTNIQFPLMLDSARQNKTKNAWANWKGRKPEIRAKMPYALSQAILEAVSE